MQGKDKPHCTSHLNSMVLKELNGALVLLRRSLAFESTEVPALPGFRIFLS
jgi:hypothetical protein